MIKLKTSPTELEISKFAAACVTAIAIASVFAAIQIKK